MAQSSPKSSSLGDYSINVRTWGLGNWQGVSSRGCLGANPGSAEIIPQETFVLSLHPKDIEKEEIPLIFSPRPHCKAIC